MHNRLVETFLQISVYQFIVFAESRVVDWLSPITCLILIHIGQNSVLLHRHPNLLTVGRKICRNRLATALQSFVDGQDNLRS